MAEIRDFVARHVSRFPQRDMEAVLPWLKPQWTGKALTLDLDAVTDWVRIQAYLEDEFVPRKCRHCAAEFPHLRAWLSHSCRLERCELPCTVVGPDLQEHRKTCCWVPVPCPWCHRSFPRHVQHTCPEEPCTCQACGAALTRSTVDEHARSCAEQQVACPHDGCSVTVGKAHLSSHVFQCPLRTLTCRWCSTQHTAQTTHECEQQPVSCPTCGITLKRGPKGAALRRHKLVAHTIPDTVRQLRQGQRSQDLAHALAMRLQCPCTTCRQFELISRFHQERETCTESCTHPLCPRQHLNCMWPGCTEQPELQHLAEHERLCSHRSSSCPVCGTGPLDLESMRQHLFPRCATVTAAMAPERAAEGRAHLATCPASSTCPTCAVWNQAFFFSGQE